jgi:hypothetical protein
MINKKLVILHTPSQENSVQVEASEVERMCSLGLEAPKYHRLPGVLVPLTENNRRILEAEGYSFRMPGS